MAVSKSDKATASVLIADWKINLSAGEADLEPRGIFLAYPELGHFISECKLGREGGRVESFRELFGSFSGVGPVVSGCKMNDVDPQAWLADVLARVAEHPVQRLDELLPWNWCTGTRQVDHAA
jgi:hypothetical protein